MIQISKLQLVTNPDKFFSMDKILFVDVMQIDNAPAILRSKLESQFGAFQHNEKMYLPITLKGSPENLFLKVKEGIPFDFGQGSVSIFSFDGKLREALSQKKIYDFSKHYKSSNNVGFAKEIDFLIERYISPYENKI